MGGQSLVEQEERDNDKELPQRFGKGARGVEQVRGGQGEHQGRSCRHCKRGDIQHQEKNTSAESTG